MIVVIANGKEEAAYLIDAFNTRGNKLIVINNDKTIADSLSKHKHVSVFVGNPWRQYILDEANIHDADLFVSLSEKDADNYASCLMAKKVYNVKRCICVVNNPANVDIYKKLGIDSVISSTYLLTENIKNESSSDDLMKSLEMDNSSIVMVEATLLSRYRIVGKAIMDIGFPKYANIAYIIRKGEFIIPNGQVVLESRDTLMIAVSKEHEKELKAFITTKSRTPIKNAIKGKKA